MLRLGVFFRAGTLVLALGVQPPGAPGLAPAWRLVPQGSDPRSPLFLLGTGNPKPPTPLLYYLSEGRRILPSR